jgi:hypothetical protein
MTESMIRLTNSIVVGIISSHQQPRPTPPTGQSSEANSRDDVFESVTFGCIFVHTGQLRAEAHLVFCRIRFRVSGKEEAKSLIFHRAWQQIILRRQDVSLCKPPSRLTPRRRPRCDCAAQSRRWVQSRQTYSRPDPLIPHLVSGRLRVIAEQEITLSPIALANLSCLQALAACWHHQITL